METLYNTLKNEMDRIGGNVMVLEFEDETTRYRGVVTRQDKLAICPDCNVEMEAKELHPDGICLGCIKKGAS